MKNAAKPNLPHLKRGERIVFLHPKSKTPVAAVVARESGGKYFHVMYQRATTNYWGEPVVRKETYDLRRREEGTVWARDITPDKDAIYAAAAIAVL